MMKLLNWMAILAVLVIAGACGDDPQGAEYGALNVSVQGVHNGSAAEVAEIQSIKVTVDPGYEQIIELSEAGWNATFSKIYVGEYSVKAIAYDQAGAKGAVLYESNPKSVSIVQGSQPQAIVIVMNQATGPGEFIPPFFDSVVLSALTIDQGEDVVITVTAGGGTGELSLSGRFSVSTPAEETGFFSEGSVDFVDGEAEITWTAPMKKVLAWFILTVRDEEGNKSEMGFTIQVGDDYGFGQFEFLWNLAPDMTILSRTLNDGDGAYLYLWILATDDRSGSNLGYDVDDTGCDGEFLDSGMVGPAAETVNNPALPGAAMYYKYEIPRATAPDSCAMIITVTDDEGASVAERVIFDTGLIQSGSPGEP